MKQNPTEETETAKALQEKEEREEEAVVSPEKRIFLLASVAVAAGIPALIGGFGVLKYLTTGLPEDQSAAITEVKLGEDVENLKNNSSTKVAFGSKPVLIIKDKLGELKAFGATCTHLACIVAYQAEKGRIFCACHGGVYDPKNGKNVAGPPPKPLSKFKIENREDGKYLLRA